MTLKIWPKRNITACLACGAWVAASMSLDALLDKIKGHKDKKASAIHKIAVWASCSMKCMKILKRRFEQAESKKEAEAIIADLLLAPPGQRNI